MASAVTASNTLDDDVHIRYEDQSKINKFAINNTKLHEFKEDLAEKRKELVNLNEAIDELVLLDEASDVVPFQYGEVFCHLSVGEAGEELEKAKQNIEKEIADLEAKVSNTNKLLSELKSQLYAKFGNKINLEEGDAE
jgi:prefoldin subunit 4